jgi:hypothetical protein
MKSTPFYELLSPQRLDQNRRECSSTVKQAVESHINSSLPLSLCADICNSLKHLHLTSSRSGKNPVFGKQLFGISVGTAPTTISLLNYEIDTTTGPIDAFDLATQSVNSWDAFLTAKGLK